MNWEAISAIVDIVGALAVVITLVYLARQTAENSRALKASSAREVTLAEAEFHQELARDPELKRIMSQSMLTEMHDYNAEEWMEFRFLAMRTFVNFEARYVDRDLQIGFEDQARNRLSIAKSLITSFPAWSRFWDEERRGNGFSSAFVQAVDSAEPTANIGQIIRPEEFPEKVKGA